MEIFDWWTFLLFLLGRIVLHSISRGQTTYGSRECSANLLSTILCQVYAQEYDHTSSNSYMLRLATRIYARFF
jgi:hypothetical protein